MALFKQIPEKFVNKKIQIQSTDDDNGTGPKNSSQEPGHPPLPAIEGDYSFRIIFLQTHVLRKRVNVKNK